MTETFTNYAHGSSPIRRIDITATGSTIVPVDMGDIQAIEDALEQDPPILHEIDDTTITILQKIASLRVLAARLKKNELISVLFLERLISGLTDKVMQQRLEEARNLMRNLGIENVANASHHRTFSPRHSSGLPYSSTRTVGG